jgi:hypothetical protein
MPVRKTFNIETCQECCVFQDCGAEGFCRLNPPQIVNQYTAAYPVVRKETRACFAGIAGSKPKPKGKKK